MKKRAASSTGAGSQSKSSRVVAPVTIHQGREEVPERFDIVAVLVDTQASQAFKGYLKTGCDTGRYEGFSILPEGQITEMDFIIVFTTG